MENALTPTVTAGCRFFFSLENRSVVRLYDRFNVHRATIAEPHIVLVENARERILRCEMLFHQIKKFSPDVRANRLTKGWIEPNNFASALLFLQVVILFVSVF